MNSTKKPSKYPRKNQTDIYQEITDQIVEMLEAGASPWRCPWDKSGLASIPLRANGNAYRGINTFVLWARAQRMGFQSPHWFTFKQAKDLGAHVRKGEKSTPVVFWKITEKDTNTIDENTGEALTEKFFMARQYRVFNADQIDGLPEKYQPIEFEGTEIERIEKADALAAATGAKIRHEGGRACYQPIADEITMPDSERFEDGEAYYATLLHEIAHWTGHESRLDRGLLTNIGRADYAREELVAEMASAFICAGLGINNGKARDESASYIASWLKALKNDKKFVFKAASAAQKAADYVMAFAERAEVKEAA